MAYGDLVGELRRGLDPVSVGAFPDGSVDDYYRLRDGESTVTSRREFARALTSGRNSFRLEHVATRPGGQAVNAAQQAAAFGDHVLLAGHLDHPVFSFDFETASMGDPAWVTVCLFGADDVMLVERSSDLADWTVTDLRSALAEPLDAFLERDALCCTNWASVPGLCDAVDEMAGRDVDGGVFCVDPGAITARQAGELLDAVGRLDTHDVVLSVDVDEANRLASAVGHGLDVRDPPADAAVLADVRAAAGVAGVVVHAEDAAVAATRSGPVSVPNLDVSRVVSATGAGDRFSAALARALAAGWDWDLSLALGNACASHYVSEDETADCDDLREYVTEYEPR